MRDFLLILLVALLWFVGGWCMGIGIQAQFEGNWIISCSSINLLMGLILTLLIIQNPRESRIFFEGPSKDDEDYLPLMTIVLLFPGIEIFIGGLWWVMAWFP